MATFNDAGRITISDRYSPVAAIPGLSQPALKHVYSDENILDSAAAAPSAQTFKPEPRIPLDEGCLITKRSGLSLARAQWLRPIRDDLRSKDRIQNFLHDSSIGGPINFELESPSNVSFLDRTLDFVIHKLGYCAVTCSKESLEALIKLVDAENKTWDEKIAADRNYARHFPLATPLFTHATYELVVLHPKHFLPKKGNSLLVFTEEGNELSGKPYFVSPDGALREGPDDSAPRLPPFTSNTGRGKHNMLNPFYVILHAEITFRRHRRSYPDPPCAEYKELIDLTIELVNKMYHPPLVKKIHNTYSKIATEEHYAELIARQRHADRVNATEITPEIPDPQSKMGKVVNHPGPGASDDQYVEYYQYLMSGYDDATEVDSTCSDD